MYNQKKKSQRLNERFNRKKSSIVDKGLRTQIGEYSINSKQLIGKGSYGDVYKAYRNQTGQLFACKMISKSQLDKLQLYDKEKVQELRKRLSLQVSFQKSLTSNNIVKLYQMLEDEKAYYLIMEFCQEDLAKYLKREGPLAENVAWNFFKQLIRGYQKIYQKKASHRDLKPQNLLLLNKELKIADFGFVKIFNDAHNISKTAQHNLKAESMVGTCKYMSPDILKTQIEKKGYNPQKSDIWSMGIILYRMLYGKQPYDGKTQIQMLKKIEETQLSFERQMQVSQGKIALISRLIQKDESKRLSFTDLVEEIKHIDENQAQLLHNESKYMLDKSLKASKFKQNNYDQQRNKKQHLIVFLNELNKKIYYDASNFATLRQIGFEENYLTYSYKLMTLIHQKRLNCLQNQSSLNEEDIKQDIKKQIAQYHNIFYLPIKMHSKLQQNETLDLLLPQLVQKIFKYEQYSLHTKAVQFFLLKLVMLYNLESKKMTVEQLDELMEMQKKVKKFTDIKNMMCRTALNS